MVGDQRVSVSAFRSVVVGTFSPIMNTEVTEGNDPGTGGSFHLVQREIMVGQGLGAKTHIVSRVDDFATDYCKIILTQSLS